MECCDVAPCEARLMLPPRSWSSSNNSKSLSVFVPVHHSNLPTIRIFFGADVCNGSTESYQKLGPSSSVSFCLMSPLSSLVICVSLFWHTVNTASSSLSQQTREFTQVTQKYWAELQAVSVKQDVQRTKCKGHSNCRWKKRRFIKWLQYQTTSNNKTTKNNNNNNNN